MSSAPRLRPALLSSLRGGYGRRDFLSDLAAGLLVGVVALPLSMGLAIASGVGPEQGLYTAIAGGLLVSLLGGSRVQVAGPAGAFVGLCAAAVLGHGYAGLAIATLLAGLWLLLFWALRLGRFIGYIPYPVVVGFTTGIAVIIASTQLFTALGLPDPDHAIPGTPARLGYAALHLGECHGASLVLAAATVAIILFLRRISLRIPGALVAVVAGALVVALAGLPVETLGSKFPRIGGPLPVPHLPLSDGPSAWWEQIQPLLGLSLGIALLVAVESLLCAVVADGMTGDRHDPDTELAAQGIANLASACCLGLPVTGVIARTSTNARAGARSPVAGIIHALTVLAALVFLSPWVKLVPLACLAGVLLSVCWTMAELPVWPRLLRAGGSDGFLLAAACAVTVLVDLVWAVGLGVALAFVSLWVRQRRLPLPESGELTVACGTDALIEARFAGHLHFGRAAEPRRIEALLASATGLRLDFSGASSLDASYAQSIRELIALARSRGMVVAVEGQSGRVARDLARFHATA